MWIFPSIQFRVERWKFNKEYGVYVSTLGNFKDRHKRNLPVKIDQKGYCAVLTENHIYVRAHRLVLKTWRSAPNMENLTVDHLNHNKRDNSLMNLEWVSRDENQKRARADQLNIDCELTACPILSAIVNQNSNELLFKIGNKLVQGREEAITLIRQVSNGYTRETAGNIVDAMLDGKNPTGKKCIQKTKQIYIEIIK